MISFNHFKFLFAFGLKIDLLKIVFLWFQKQLMVLQKAEAEIFGTHTRKMYVALDYF